MELAWRRQAERDALMAQQPSYGTVMEVRDMQHLESVLDHAGSCLVVLCLYSRSCGACKRTLQRFEQLCFEAQAQRVRAVFCRHNIVNEFDDLSDVCRWYKARAVPSFLFYDDGALVRQLTLRDVRRLSGSPAAIQRAMHDDLSLLGDVFREMVFKTAPGARP